MAHHDLQIDHLSPGMPLSSSQTPIMRLFWEWEAATKAEDQAALDGLPDHEIDPISAVRWEIEKRMLAEPCRAPQDFICKVVAYTCDGTFAMKDRSEAPELWAEARALIAGA